jgi:uncharacterized protein
MKINKLRIVLDTNILLVGLMPHHEHFWVFEGLENAKFTLILSNEILEEYAEKITERYDKVIAEAILENIVDLKNTEKIEPSYRFLLIKDDPDDDKFVDCAIAGNADYIITHDKHYNVLKDIPFPKVETLKIDEFKDILDNWEKEAFE